MIKHIKFTADGIPGAIFDQPRPDAEPVDLSFVQGDVIAFLASMRRRPNGTWAKRPNPPKPTAEEIAAQREAERLARQEQRREERRLARDAARRERLFDRLVEVAARIDPDFAAAVADLEAEFKDEAP